MLKIRKWLYKIIYKIDGVRIDINNFLCDLELNHGCPISFIGKIIYEIIKAILIILIYNFITNK